MSNSITKVAKGSLQDVATKENKSLAETFMNCDYIILIDMSGSMSEMDALGGKSRFDAAESELRKLQENLPGKIAVIAFSSWPTFCPSGIPTRLGGGTDMLAALQFVKCADDTGIKFILISDGEPGQPQKTLALAKSFRSKIDTIYIGSEQNYTGGRDFLTQLANATGGKFTRSDSPGTYEKEIMLLLQG